MPLPKTKYRRPSHNIVATVLGALNAKLLAECHCYFGGGTQIALLLDEYRESRDIDFLCSDRAGFRRLRETVSNVSLGAIMKSRLPLAREVRADRDGIRTFFSVGPTKSPVKIKFEILLEGRIDLQGSDSKALRVPTLSFDCMVAEKFLALTDRGMDETTHSRDLIDIAFISARHGGAVLRPGFEMAETVYGKAVLRAVRDCLSSFARRATYRDASIRSLQIQDTASLRSGLKQLRAFATAMRRKAIA